MRKTKTILSIFATVLLLTGCNQYTEVTKMDASTDIAFTHTMEEVEGRITILEEYQKNDEKHYTINTDLDNHTTKHTARDKLDISVTASEYDKMFGKGNNAFDTNKYQLDLEVPIVEYTPETNKMTDLIKNASMENPLERSVGIIQKGFFDTRAAEYFKYHDAVEQYPFSYNDCYVEVTGREDDFSGMIRPSRAILHITVSRYSAFGQQDFTEEEIEEFKQIAREVGMKFIEEYVTPYE